ncbi:SGNH/GDSL hydrolase family protein [Hominifimenecus sp. rT4P-3]|uniref:SGNH/GDSL hydrolase family protein n=1 Tax=Hominifimenecus sp. rT4P-3 TaxID=3242979 RepID=UPI003DA5CEBF
MKKKRFLTILVVACLLVGGLWFLQKLLTPKYINDIIEGRLIADYYDNAGGNDVIFVGDCEVYENISPITLWEEYGITSYIRGSAQQLIWQSYYLMEETLKYEKPKVMVFNVLSMKYGEPQNEAYNRMTLDGMRWSNSKVKSIQASMTEEEDFITYLFPILRYHSRWSELSGEDFEYLFQTKRSFHQGYLMRVDVRPVTSAPSTPPLQDYRFSDTSYEYLDKMVKLCKENGVELVLMKAPSIYPHWYDEWEEQMEDYAEKNGLRYINFLELLDETGIDFETDTYDNGLHLNLSGAEKLAKYLGAELQEAYQLPDHRGDAEVAAKWQEKADFYHEMEADQHRELEEYGYLKSYGGRKPSE